MPEQHLLKNRGRRNTYKYFYLINYTNRLFIILSSFLIHPRIRCDITMMQDYRHELSLIKDLLKKNPEGMSVTDISKALNKNKNTIGRYLDILLISGQVEMRSFGMAKVFKISHRVPLSALLSYSKELIMVLDEESRIIDVNDNFLTLLNLSRQDTTRQEYLASQPPRCRRP